MKEDLAGQINLRLSNAPKTNEPDKRLIGFVVGVDELEHGMGWFSPLLEQYCALYLKTKGYDVIKKPVNDRLTLEERA